MNEFKGFHPAVNFTFFCVSIIFSMIFMHPMCLVLSCLASLCYLTMLKGIKALKKKCGLLFCVVLVCAAVNPLFNHRGVTTLAYLPSGNPLTLEAIVYGAVGGMMICTVIFWFGCYNNVMTSDKFICLFGNIIPSMSLVLSMTFRFVPKFKNRLKDVADGQKAVGKSVENGGVIERLRCGMNIFSILVTWCMEDAIETADSMKSRGYGTEKRTAFSVYKFDGRDFATTVVIMVLSAIIIFGVTTGNFKFSYYPVISSVKFNVFIIAYFALVNIPVVIEIWEDIRWKYLKSKI